MEDDFIEDMKENLSPEEQKFFWRMAEDWAIFREEKEVKFGEPMTEGEKRERLFEFLELNGLADEFLKFEEIRAERRALLRDKD